MLNMQIKAAITENIVLVDISVSTHSIKMILCLYTCFKGTESDYTISVLIMLGVILVKN